MILALNTTEPTHEMALIKDDKILASKTWQDQKDDLTRLIPILKELLEKSSAKKSEITDIAVVKGPGSFTAVRTAVAFANALKMGLKAALHTIDNFTLLKLKAHTKKPSLIVLNAGGLDVALMQGHEVKVGPLAPLLAAHPHGEFQVISMCTETQTDELKSICNEKNWPLIPSNELKSMAEVIASSGLNEFNLEDLAEVYYLKSPLITKSSDPWKKPTHD